MAKKMFPHKTDLDSPRIRFNWGFWDGCQEATWKKAARAEHTNPYYAEGYQRGYALISAGSQEPDSSTGAWQNYISSLDENQKYALKKEIWECNVGGLENCLKRRADTRIINRATETTEREMQA